MIHPLHENYINWGFSTAFQTLTFLQQSENEGSKQTWKTLFLPQSEKNLDRYDA